MKDLKKLAVQALYDSVYYPLLESWNAAYAKDVEPYLQLLRNVRSLATTPELTANTIAMLGYDFKASEFTDEQLSMLLKSLNNMKRSRGSAAAFNFLGLIKNVPFKIVPLWTRNYKEFIPYSNSVARSTIDKGGAYYITSHVNLKYDATQAKLRREDLEDFFYEVAPANLVLHSVVAGVSIINPRDAENSVKHKDLYDKLDELKEHKQAQESNDQNNGGSTTPGSSHSNPGSDSGGGSSGGSSGSTIEDEINDQIDDLINDENVNTDAKELDIHAIDDENELKELVKKQNIIYLWQQHPAYMQRIVTANMKQEPAWSKGVAITAGHVWNKKSEQEPRFNVDIRYLYNGHMKGLTYNRSRQLVRWFHHRKDFETIHANEFYYTGDRGYAYITDANTNYFKDSTTPRFQTIFLKAGVYTFWSRGFSGYTYIDLGHNNVIEQPVNGQNTITLQHDQQVVVKPQLGIMFYQVERSQVRTQGIFSTYDYEGLKPKDHLYTDIDKLMTCRFEFQLIYSSSAATAQIDNRFKTVLSVDRLCIQMNPGLKSDHSDSKIRIMNAGNKVLEQDAKLYKQKDDTIKIELLLEPHKIIFIKQDKQELDFSTQRNRVWFGSDNGADCANLFVKNILIIEGDLIH